MQTKIWKIVLITGIFLYTLLTTAVLVIDKKNKLRQQSQAEQKTESPKPVNQSAAAKPVYQEKEAQLKRSLAENPSDPQKQAQLASLYYQQGKLDPAMRQYEKILEKKPGDIEAHLALAQLYMGRKELKDKALQHLKKVRELDPDHPKARIIDLWIRQMEKK